MSDNFDAQRTDGGSGRGRRRWPVDIETVAVIGIRSVDCAIHDLSPAGAQIEILSDAPVRVGDQVRIEMFEFGWLDTVARSVEGRRIGVQFMLDEEDMVELARFMVSLRISQDPPRQNVARHAELRVGGDALTCTVVNISPTGASVMLLGVPEFAEGENVALALPEHEPIAAIVQRIDGSICGLNFLVRFDGDVS